MEGGTQQAEKSVREPCMASCAPTINTQDRMCIHGTVHNDPIALISSYNCL